MAGTAERISAARAFMRVLRAEGVDTVFLLTGGHIVGFIDAAVQEGMRLIDVRHEEAAAHAADAYARLTGKPGVAFVTAGPGATNAVTGVAAAWHAGSPLVLVVGRHPEFQDQRGALQEMDHRPIFQGISKWTATGRDPERFGELAVTALRHATAGRGGPVVIEVDALAQLQEVSASTVPDSAGTRASHSAGADEATVQEMARLLSDAERPVIFGGTGLRWSRVVPDLAGLGAALDAPVFLNSLARGAVPWGHRLLGNRARSFALSGADLVVALGVDWDFRTRFGGVVAENARVVQVDQEPTRIGWNRAADIGIIADPGVVVAQLVGAVGPGSGASEWLEAVRTEEHRRQSAADEAAQAEGSPVPPERFARDVAEFFGTDSIVAVDGGDIVSTTAKWLRTSELGHLLDPGPLGCLGVGAPFAIAAKAVYPDRRVGIVYGDGGFGFNGMEYDTLVRHGLPVVGVVGNDGAWNNTKAFHRMWYPDRLVAEDLGVRPYHEMVRGLGGHGEFVDDAAELLPALERAAESGLPALVNVHIAEQTRMSSNYGF